MAVAAADVDDVAVRVGQRQVDRLAGDHVGVEHGDHSRPLDVEAVGRDDLEALFLEDGQRKVGVMGFTKLAFGWPLQVAALSLMALLLTRGRAADRSPR